MDFFRERWFLLPILSATLLILALPPINFWPLVVVALVPLFYNVGAYNRSTREIFFCGALTGSLLIFSLYYLTLFQFHWLPGSEGLVMLVRAGIIPVTLFGAALLGVCLYVYSRLRTSFLALNAILGGLVYLPFEIVFNFLFQGYYTGTLGYLLAPVPFIMSFASLGGVLLVSFMIAAASCLVAEMAATPHALRSFTNRLGVTVLVGGFVAAGLGNMLYLAGPGRPVKDISVAIVQPGVPEQVLFNQGVSKPPAGSAPVQADILVYPFSFFDGVLYEEELPPAPLRGVPFAGAGGHVAAAFPQARLVVTWESVMRGDVLYNTFEFWKDGEIVAEYKKQSLHFLDSTPAWFADSGLYRSPFAYEVGEEEGPIAVEGVAIGTLICSELVDVGTVAVQAERAFLLLAIGSEAMFLDDTIGLYSLRAAQFRAAEYNVPVVRATALGPSAVIDRTGKILAYAPWGEEHIIAAKITLREAHPTLYARLGHTLLLLLGGGALATALYLKRRSRFLGMMGQ